ncbi:MAG TPA: ABC transporter ATP-binding protein [Tenuifilaceae bacterium]|nr:ABC transporter ATP-binding protein [Tenuifilaceae bacterium]
MATIEALGLAKSFGDKNIFNSLDIRVEKGQRVAIKGESGKGKTTLLRILAGIAEADSGRVLYNDKEFNAITAKTIRNHIAYLPQGIDLMVNDGNELCRMLAVDNEKVVDSLSVLGLNVQVLNQPMAELSGGERQRMLISIILGLNRSILFLDEPTSALDDTSIKKVIDLIWSQTQLTLVSTSHNTIWVEHCDKVISL